MRKIVLMILSILLLAGQMLAQDGLRIMEGLAMQSRILNQDVKFSVCLPEDYYDDNRRYPVVFMLHGLGDDAASWLEYGRISQYYDAEIEAGEITPMIFIMPEGYRTYYVNDYKGTFLYQDMFIKELVPYVDKMFRTLPDPQHRALTGYSMGGFGALIMHLQHPDVFGSAVPLSISIRTDEQYMVEYAPEWDEQWGRLFGAVGAVGPERITEYYKKNSPFYIIPELSSSEKKNFKIYIDNGDKEETLCRSNEELHILMRNEDFPHEFRIREGGHSFSYWCSALPNALHFFSDAFEGKPYRGDVKEDIEDFPVIKPSQPLTLQIGNDQVVAFVPYDFHQTSRSYPALFVTSDIGTEKLNQIVSAVDKAVETNEIGPAVVISIPEKLLSELPSILPQLESELRLRNDYHFRSIIGYRENATLVCELVINRMQFSSCVLIDGFLEKNNVINMINKLPEDALKKTPIFISYADKGDYYEGNGNMHMLLRDKEIKHEYRVVEGIGGLEDWGIGGLEDWGIGGLEDWGIGGLEEIIRFVSVNFHR
jgi:enterochelin esterase-like enzyme